MNVAMITMEAYENRGYNSVGSSRIRGRWVMETSDLIKEYRLGQKYDAMIYQKAYWREHMEQFKGIKIFDLCDPDWLEGRPVVEVAEHVHAFTVPTETMQKYLQPLVPVPVFTVPDRVKLDEHVPNKTHHAKKLTSAVWFGYSNNAWVLEPVMNILKNYGITMTMISDRPHMDADAFIKYDYKEIHLQLIDYDIAILPTHRKHQRFAYKSNNKDLTCHALNLPVVKEYEDLERLLPQEARIAEAKKCYDEVVSKYNVAKSGPEYLSIITKLQKEHKHA